MLDAAPVTPARAAAVESWVPRPGAVIDGRYRIEQIVGCGTMGAVVAARHIPLDRRIAIKFLRPERARDRVPLERFHQEAIAASRIRSDHVVRIHDVGTTDDGIPFMAMELLEGTDLEKLAEQGPLPITLAVDCILQAAEVLAEAHIAGIVHRDIKPSNLFLSKGADDQPLLKVLDFGISKLAEDSGGDPMLTATQSMMGSPAYMAPEQVRTSKYVTAKADVWALGVVLFEILTTKLPFDGATLGAVLAAVTVDPPRSLRALRPELPEAIEAAVLGCFEKDPSRRGSLADLAARLRPFASSASVVSADRVIRIARASDPSAAMDPQSLVPPPPASSVRHATPTTSPAGRSARLAVILVGVGLVVVVLTAAVVGLGRRAGVHDAIDAEAALSASVSSSVLSPPIAATGTDAPSSPMAAGSTDPRAPAPAPSATAVPPRPSKVPPRHPKPPRR